MSIQTEQKGLTQSATLHNFVPPFALNVSFQQTFKHSKRRSLWPSPFSVTMATVLWSGCSYAVESEWLSAKQASRQAGWLASGLQPLERRESSAPVILLKCVWTLDSVSLCLPGFSLASTDLATTSSSPCEILKKKIYSSACFFFFHHENKITD